MLINNNSFLKNAGVGNISDAAQLQARKQITENWEKAGFTNGLTGYLKENLATLFENEATMMLNESTTADNSGSFETVIFPLVRRIFSRLLANDIVSVQAMNMPIGRLFFIKPVTSERKWEELDNGAEGKEIVGSHYGLMGASREDRRNGGSVNRAYLPDECVDLKQKFEMLNEQGKWVAVAGNTYAEAVKAAQGKEVRHMDDSNAMVRYIKTSLYDLFYNDGLFDHSKGKIHIKTGNVTPVVFGTKNQSREFVDMTGTTLPTHIDGTVRNVIVKVTGFSKCNAGRLTGPDGNEMDTEAFLSSLRVVALSAIKSSKVNEKSTAAYAEFEPIHYRCVTQRYGHGIVERGDACDAEGAIYLELDFAKPTVEVGATFDGYIGIDPEQMKIDDLATKLQVAWAQYDSLELETELPEVSFNLSFVTVSVEERKLRATWSPELAQDVAAFHNIDAEAELTALLSEQIAAEIDREILRDLKDCSPNKLRWDYNGWRRQSVYSTNYTQKDWNQTFVTKVNQISSQIHKGTLRGGASFIVVSTEIAAMLNDLEYFHVTDASAESMSYSMGIEKIGMINGRYQVYVDPYSPARYAIIGHKGDSMLDTGYIYAPYIPMQLSPVVINPFNMAPVRAIMTRYAKKLVNNRFYGTIVCDGLQSWDPREFR